VQAGLRAAQPPDLLVHVHRQADGACAPVGGTTRDGLTDPPRGVGGELESLAPVELLDRAQEAEVALLDQVTQRQAGRREAPRDGDDEPQVGLDHLAPGGLAPGDLDPKSGNLAGIGRVLREPGRGSLTGLERLGELDLVVLGEQRVAAHLVEVEAERVRGLEFERLVF
jgi:hypothetical protein